MAVPKFGWLSPVAGHAGSDFVPIVMYQDEHILPTVLPHFDSVWIADHFYGFDADKKEGFLEAWTSLTWLAARYPDVGLCHHVLGHGYRNPALTAKMASTLQVLSGGRFMLGIGAGWREDEYRGYGYDFPKASIRLHQLEEVVQICRLMWTEPHPTFDGRYFHDRRRRGARRAPTSSHRSASAVPASRSASRSSGGTPTCGTVPTSASDDDWKRQRAIVDAAAVAAGRRPEDIESCVTLAGDLPDSDMASEQWVERLTHLTGLGITYFVMDFGHPLDPEPGLRFAEQVIAPLRSA